MATANLGRVGFVNKGTYSGSTAYKVNDVVTYNSGTYACIQANTGQAPTNTSYWQNWVEDNAVHKAGDETIAGIKSFSNGLKLQNQNVSPFSGFKNYIINGKKVVNQRWLTSTDNSYNQDRWYKSGNNWYQGIEGVNNLISGKTYTLSWEGAATASYYVGTETSATINAQTFTPISNGGSFTLTIAAGQNLWIKFVSDATGSTFSSVQLEEGSVATPFENRPYGLELSLCQRYYVPIFNAGNANGLLNSGYFSTTSNLLTYIPVPVPMRVGPSLIITGPISTLFVTTSNTTATNISYTGSTNSLSSFRLDITTTGGTSGLSSSIRSNIGGANLLLAFSAEL